ncbi:MAG: DNA polymerase Y family protein, partial [Corynebacterium sp.]|nr:DNA polymerase Y family protein [Corynebacterium sp.]
MRVAAVWFPDWPIQAVGGQGPMVIARNHAVAVCDRAARRAGVRRGMRLRQAQALCPEATVVEANPDRDGAAFAEVAAGLDAVASSVEVLRPGLAIVDAG